VEHLLRRLYGVDAPDYNRRKRTKTPNSSQTFCAWMRLMLHANYCCWADHDDQETIEDDTGTAAIENDRVLYRYCMPLSIITELNARKKMNWQRDGSGYSSRSNKKAQLTLSNPRDAKAYKNCSNSTCFVSFHRIPFPWISNYRCIASRG